MGNHVNHLRAFALFEAGTLLHMATAHRGQRNGLSFAMRATDYLSIPDVRPGQALSVRRVQRVLDQLRESVESGMPAATLHLPATIAADSVAIAGLLRREGGPAWIDALERASNHLLGSSTGLVAFRVGDAGLAILPPFPTDATGWDEGINDEPLRALLGSRFTVGVALVRLGRYAIAVYEGQQLVVSKTDTRYVKSRHHAGGTSQQRFRRVARKPDSPAVRGGGRRAGAAVAAVARPFGLRRAGRRGRHRQRVRQGSATRSNGWRPSPCNAGWTCANPTARHWIRSARCCTSAAPTRCGGTADGRICHNDTARFNLEKRFRLIWELPSKQPPMWTHRFGKMSKPC